MTGKIKQIDNLGIYSEASIHNLDAYRADYLQMFDHQNRQPAQYDLSLQEILIIETCTMQAY